MLCGGLGTRLRAAVADRPKVLAPVAGAPFLHHQLRFLARVGARRVVLATGYLGEQVEAWAAAHAPEGLDVRCVQEREPLGTGGALAHAARATGIAEPFLALNGDTFFGGDPGALVEAHRRAGAEATLALAHVPDAARYGRVTFEAADEEAPVRVTGFAEKGAAGVGWINAGVYVLGPAVLAAVPEGRAVSLEREVFPGLAARGALAALRFPGAPFLDIGTPEDYAGATGVLAALGL